MNRSSVEVTGTTCSTVYTPDIDFNISFVDAGANLLLRGEKPHLFLLGHSHGTDWVEYNAQGWLSHAKHNSAAQNAATLLQDSQK